MLLSATAPKLPDTQALFYGKLAGRPTLAAQISELLHWGDTPGYSAQCSFGSSEGLRPECAA